MSRSLLFKNVDVANGGVVNVNRDVLVVDGRIARNDQATSQEDSNVLVVHGPGLLAPGFVDTHVHGHDGLDVMCPGDLGPLSRGLLQQGVTGFLPTMISASPADMMKALHGAHGDPAGAKILGVHMEGPFLSPEQPGMFDPVNFSRFDMGLWTKLCTVSAVPIRLMTVAAERLDPKDLGELVGTGLILSLGHTDASYSTASGVFGQGVTRVTHAYNAMRGVHHRDPGAVGALLDHGEIDAEIETVVQIDSGAHVAWISLLFADVVEMKHMLEVMNDEYDEIEITILSNSQFKADKYFDIATNRWSLNGSLDAYDRARLLCTRPAEDTLL